MKTPGLRTLEIAVLCVACMASAPLMAQMDDLAVDVDVRELVDANNLFAFALLDQITTNEPGTNIFISPISASTAMQMVSAGAAGTTRLEIQSALQTEVIPPARLNAALSHLADDLTGQVNGELNLADGMWYQKDFRLNPDFTTVIHDSFHAESTAVDFADPATANLINQWAVDHTHGRIKNLVSSIPDGTALILANAIYFKANWMSQFDKALTKPRDFYLADGTVKPTPMMSKHSEFDYEETDEYQAVHLPYKNRGWEMIIFLPKKHRSPQQLLADFGSQAWTSQHHSIFLDRNTEGTLEFPKFKIDYEVLLNDPLTKLGIRQAFDSSAANFSLMGAGPAPIYISEVKQKSFVDVDEEGTEAASVTEVRATYGAEETPPKPFQMIVNRPFLFVITSWAGPYSAPIVLFMGIVNEPGGEF